MYVWVDALTNYITATGWLTGQGEKTRFWPADAHVIGKDITRFHAIFWPAFLMSAGAPLPKKIVVHGFLFSRGEKMSKSVGNVVDPMALAERYGVDQLRYFFLREISFGQDGNYSHEAIVNRINADLANDLGNLAQHSLSMINKNCGAAVPKKGALLAQDEAILAEASAALGRARGFMDAYRPDHALSEIFRVVAEANRYFAGEEPWTKKKTDPVRMETILYVTAETLRRLAIPLQPFMPAAAGKFLDLLGVPAEARDFASAGEGHASKEGAPLPAPTPVFPRFVEEEAAPAPTK
jgi:methionyl-tRNA synthetase